MTGIQRLRELSKGMHNHGVSVWQLTDDAYAERSGVTKYGPTIKKFLSDIADQMEDERDEDRDAVAWVREHGGLSHIRQQWGYLRGRANHADHVDRKLAKRQRQIDESHAALRRRNDMLARYREANKALLDRAAAMKRRLMPEGMEWPMVDGEPVVIGERLVGYCSDGDGYEVVGVRPTCGWVLVKSCDHIHRDGGPVILEWDASKCHRPAPKVLDADGVEIRVGDTVWHVESGERCKVVEVDSRSVSVDFYVENGGTKHTGSILPINLTHRAPVLAADGRPLREGETVWDKDGYGPLVIVRADEETLVKRPEGFDLIRLPEELTHQRPVLDADGVPIKVGDVVWSLTDGRKHEVTGIDPIVKEIRIKDESMELVVWVAACGLTHTKPEPPDSWERLEEDVAGASCPDVYCANRHVDASDTSYEWAMARDIVRRARALAERGQ